MLSQVFKTFSFKKTVMFLAIGVCLGLVGWFALLGRTTRASQENSRRPVLSKLPEITSCLQHIKLIKAQLKTYDGVQFAELELENQGYVGVIAIAVETWIDKDKHEVVKSGFSPDKEPAIIIPARQKDTIRIGNLSPSSPIRISSVVFADGTEEGCESSLKTVREVKAHDTKKAGPEK